MKYFDREIRSEATIYQLKTDLHDLKLDLKVAVCSNVERV